MFYTSGGCQIIDKWPHKEQEIEELTGYSWKEMAMVEYVFETNTQILFEDYHDFSEKEIMEDQFKGLMAVMDVLIELDRVEEGETYKDNFKNKFVSIN